MTLTGCAFVQWLRHAFGVSTEPIGDNLMLLLLTVFRLRSTHAPLPLCLPIVQIPDVSGQVGRRVRTVARAMIRHLRDGRRGELVRGGMRLAILGRPNAGKSTFLNALLRRPVAIVSPIPGERY